MTILRLSAIRLVVIARIGNQSLEVLRDRCLWNWETCNHLPVIGVVWLLWTELRARKIRKTAVVTVVAKLAT